MRVDERVRNVWRLCRLLTSQGRRPDEMLSNEAGARRTLWTTTDDTSVDQLTLVASQLTRLRRVEEVKVE